jgi:hypothetical protein
VRLCLEAVKEVSTDNPITNVQENETEEWIKTNKGVGKTEATIGDQIIDSVME